MHEMSLMYEIIQLVSEDAKLRGFQKVKQIQVIVGDLSNVLPDALELAFLFLCKERAGLLNEESQLTIIREKAISQCQNCLFKFEPDSRIALCPKCNLLDGLIISGEKFQVEFYEGSD
ncbi:hydrogenase maturation nickel metallochaperone HypA [Lysinibacillus sphaericus]|nr:hydrogenase maturation nickel metallochaperone HypA [Lysinibacillus sphaericus]